jgi:GT2 family glycosyltransferase
VDAEAPENLRQALVELQRLTVQISVIIVNYNVRVFLENAIVSITKALHGISGEIIVVDNASDDGSVEMLRQKFPAVGLIESKKNVGFAAANNLALKVSRGDNILLINPDTVVQEDTLRVMVRFFEENPDAGLAGCKVLNPDGSLQLACRRSIPTPWVALTKIVGLSALFPHSPVFARYNLTYLNPDAPAEVDAVSGSFMFVRRKVVDEVGGLDEQFFMYGEDLDWCYRIEQAGWKIYYTPATQIIHYKGQSARRSDIDEVKLFYQAMRIFVRKHFKHGVLSRLLLGAGIGLREWIAFMMRIAKPLRAAAVDFVFVNVSLLVGELIWFGDFFRFPSYAYPVTVTVPWLVIALTMYSLGVYTTRRLSISRAASSVIIGYVILSALTFFFKQYGFSRMVVLLSGAFNLLVLPGWRFLAVAVLPSPGRRQGSLFGRRTIIVGVGTSGQEVLKKLRARVDDGYDVVGFIDSDRKRVGEKVSGVEILGSIDNIGKVIQEQKASEVIFSSDCLSYADILSVIGRSGNKTVNYRLVPNSLEVIIGKTHIDQLDDIPLLDIEYNIDRLSNRLGKRLFDMLGSLILMMVVYPVARFRSGSKDPAGKFQKNILLVPKVLSGEMSLIGPPAMSVSQPENGLIGSGVWWGKPGLTGLVQINDRDDLTNEEIVRYNLYYAKNQTLLLDLEILFKSFSRILKG